LTCYYFFSFCIRSRINC